MYEYRFRIKLNIAEKYSVDYKELIGRGKSHQVKQPRRELVHELITKDFEVTDIAEFLSNRALSIIRRLDESYLSREDNKRRER